MKEVITFSEYLPQHIIRLLIDSYQIISCVLDSSLGLRNNEKED